MRFSPLHLVLAMSAVSLIVLAGRYVRANHNSALEAAAPQSPQVIPQPSTWQPFEAQLTVTKPDAPTLSGFYYRASNGSEKYDESTADGTLRFVTIVNVEKGWQYACDLIHSICQREPTESGKMRRIGLRRMETRGLVKSDKQIEGYDLYEYTNAQGLVSLQAPALNFAELTSQRPDGSQFALTHIRLGEPSPSLFEPPAVAKMIDAKRAK